MVSPVLCTGFGIWHYVLNGVDLDQEGESSATGLGLLWYILKLLERLVLASVGGHWDVEQGEKQERKLRSCMLPFYHEPRFSVTAFVRWFG